MGVHTHTHTHTHKPTDIHPWVCKHTHSHPLHTHSYIPLVVFLAEKCYSFLKLHSLLLLLIFLFSRLVFIIIFIIIVVVFIILWLLTCCGGTTITPSETHQPRTQNSVSTTLVGFFNMF